MQNRIERRTPQTLAIKLVKGYTANGKHTPALASASFRLLILGYNIPTARKGGIPCFRHCSLPSTPEQHVGSPTLCEKGIAHTAARAANRPRGNGSR